MCGITGFWDTTLKLDAQGLQAVAQQMTDTLFLRGPDDGGQWVDESRGIALGHRRLAILDLSPEGHQPMVSADSRFIIVFNGEIYNFLDIRKQLEQLGYKFRGHSDTEVMLASFCEWGLEKSIKSFNGMFAFALWDRRENVLHLGRDRFGEKPLYYGWFGSTFLFSSELKALRAYPNFSADVNRSSLTAMLRYKYVPAPNTIYENIYQLLPGTFLTIKGRNSSLNPITYWSAKEAAEQGSANRFTGSENEAVEQLEKLLKDSVALRMISDVPLGAFLSGGVDSSTIVALMQAQSEKPIKTFSIGFGEDEYNEAQYAQAVAEHLGTDHTEMYVSSQDAFDLIPKIPSFYDEPFGDCSQIPTFLLAQMTREHVTVSLSGDAGDELFSGYERYFDAADLWEKVNLLPSSIRKLVSKSLGTIPPSAWDKIVAPFASFLPSRLTYPTPGEQVQKIRDLMLMPSADAIYSRLLSSFQDDAASLVVGGEELSTALNGKFSLTELSDCIERFMYLDTVTYLPDDILVKVDRASMGVSLESRIPLLDPRIYDFAWSLPMSMKFKEGKSKHVLRQVLYKYVPSELIDRPKMGFGIPIHEWLRGPLRDWAEDLLDENRLQQEGFLEPKLIRKVWEEHINDEGDRGYGLWNILMFQAWLAENT